MRDRLLAVAALAVGAFGCSVGASVGALDGMQPAPLATVADVERVRLMSAPRVLAEGLSLPLASIAQGSGECPKAEVLGNTTRYVGGCTNANGVKYSGELIEVRLAPGPSTGTYTYKEFTREFASNCDGMSLNLIEILNGSVKVTGDGRRNHFDLDLLIERDRVSLEDCTTYRETTAIDYVGVVDGMVPSASEPFPKGTWSGSGRTGIAGVGVVEVETKDEVLDRETCRSTPLSGTTTLRSGGNTAVVTYKGASLCEGDGRASLTINGEAQEDLTNVSCGTGGAGPLVLGLLALGGLLVRRRRA